MCSGLPRAGVVGPGVERDGMRSKRFLLLIPSIVISISAAPTRADTTDVIVSGTARFGLSCAQLHGYSVQGRSRWEGTFSVSAPTQLAAGLCNELDPHEDVIPSCWVHANGTLYASGKGTDNKTYAVRVVDNGTSGDLIGVVQTVVPKGAPLCGAGDVALQPVAEGGFTVVPVSP